MSLNQETKVLLERISQLEGEKAELQRVYQFGLDVWNWIEERGGDVFHDEDSEQIMPMALRAGLVQRVIYDPVIHGENIEADPGDEIWWFGVPIKNLPKFVTEEEYLRVKEVLNGRIADLSIDFMLLKSHAEAMAETIKEFCLDYDNMDEYSQSLKAFRKDFPK